MRDLCAMFKRALLQTQVQLSKWLSTVRANCFWEHFQEDNNVLFLGLWLLILCICFVVSNTYFGWSIINIYINLKTVTVYELLFSNKWGLFFSFKFNYVSGDCYEILGFSIQCLSCFVLMCYPPWGKNSSRAELKTN